MGAFPGHRYQRASWYIALMVCAHVSQLVSTGPGEGWLTEQQLSAPPVVRHGGYNTVPYQTPASRSRELRSTALPALTANEKQFFNRKLLRLHERFCGRNRLCLNNAAHSRCNKCSPCACDLSCHDFRDCCPDVALETLDPLTAPRPFTGVDTHVVHCVDTVFNLAGLARHHPHLRPIAVPASSDHSRAARQGIKPYAQNYYMVSRCPNSFTEDANFCEEENYEAPVTARFDNTTFKNIHCARCHGYKDVSFWYVRVDCDSRQNLTSAEAPLHAVVEALKKPDCSVYFSPPEHVDVRKCYSSPKMITSCNVTGQWLQRDPFIERACHTYITTKFVDGILYKNPFCYLCNQREEKKLSVPKCPPKPWLRKRAFLGSVPYESVVNRQASPRLTAGDDKNKCGDRGVYDQKEAKCREVRCPRAHQLVSGTCIPLFHRARGLGYELYFGLRSPDVFDIAGDHSLLHGIQDDTEKFTNKTLLQGKFTFQYFAMAFNRTDARGRCSPDTATAIGVYAHLVSRTARPQSDTQAALLAARHASFHIRTRTLNVTFHSFPSELPWHLMHPSTRQTSLTQVPCVFLVQNNHLEQRRDGLRVVGTTTPDPSTPGPPPFIRLSSIVNCPQVALMPHEYATSGPEDGLLLSWTDKPLPPSRYIMDLEGNVTICLSDFLSKIEGNPRTDLEMLTAYIVLPISIALMAMSFLVFLLFAALRTLPGRNNMMLLIAQILCQTMLLCGYFVDNFSKYCVVIGALAHYFALAVHCALTVCSYHVYTIFTTMHLSENIPRENRAFSLYIVFIELVPLMIVGIVMIFYATNAASASLLGYGQGALCFLTSSEAVWISLFVPMILSLAVNIALFCRTCVTLRQNKDLETNVTDERHVHFYFRTSVLTFTSWLVYVIAAQTAVSGVLVAFIILQCLLGAYIFAALVVNRRVCGLLYSLLCEGNHMKDGEDIKLDPVGQSSSGDSMVVVTGYRRTSSEPDHRNLSGNGYSEKTNM